jgi:hypothetical protein
MGVAFGRPGRPPHYNIGLRLAESRSSLRLGRYNRRAGWSGFLRESHTWGRVSRLGRVCRSAPRIFSSAGAAPLGHPPGCHRALDCSQRGRYERDLPYPRRSWPGAICFVQRLCAIQLSPEYEERVYRTLASELKRGRSFDAARDGRIPLQPDVPKEGLGLDAKTPGKGRKSYREEGVVFLVSGGGRYSGYREQRPRMLALHAAPRR